MREPRAVNALLRMPSLGSSGDHTGLAGILVKFEVKDKTSAGGNLVFVEEDDVSEGILVDSSNKQIWDSSRNARVTRANGKVLYIRTGSDGAMVDFRLGTAAEQKVTVSAVGETEEESAFTAASENYELSVDEIQSRSGEYHLYVLAEKDEEPVDLDWDVIFTTSHGVFEGTGDTDDAVLSEQMRRIIQHTNEQGIAYVIFDPDSDSGALQVTASIKNDADNADADAITVDQITIDVRGGGSTVNTRQPSTPRPTITLSPPSISGDAGDTETLNVLVRDQDSFVVPDVRVTFSLETATGGLSPASDFTDSRGRASTTLTLPSSDDTVVARVTVDGVSVSDSTSITVTAPGNDEEDEKKRRSTSS